MRGGVGATDQRNDGGIGADGSVAEEHGPMLTEMHGQKIGTVRSVIAGDRGGAGQRETMAPLSSLTLSPMRHDGMASEAMVRMLPSSMRRLTS